MAIKLKSHPAADLFPMMGEGELAALAKDIKAHGLRQAVVTCKLEDELVVLDGRNRLRACEAAGVAPRFETFAGDDPFAFVVSANMHRRDLTKSQKAMLALELEKLYAEEAKRRQREHGGTAPGKAKNTSGSPATSEGDATRAREQAARAVGVSGRLVQEAKRVVAKGSPEVVEAVRSGKTAVWTAAVALREDETPEPAPESSPASSASPAPSEPPSSKRPDPRRHTAKHDVVRKLTEEGYTASDIEERTGLKASFIYHARRQVLAPKSVLLHVIHDAEAIAETWASRANRLDPRWATASAAEREQLTAALQSCVRAAKQLIRRLNKEGSTGDIAP